MEIRNISYIDVTGTFKGDTAVKIECSDSVPCKGIFMQNINLIGDGEEVKCVNVVDPSYEGVIRPYVPCSKKKIVPP